MTMDMSSTWWDRAKAALTIPCRLREDEEEVFAWEVLFFDLPLVVLNYKIAFLLGECGLGWANVGSLITLNFTIFIVRQRLVDLMNTFVFSVKLTRFLIGASMVGFLFMSVGTPGFSGGLHAYSYGGNSYVCTPSSFSYGLNVFTFGYCIVLSLFIILVFLISLSKDNMMLHYGVSVLTACLNLLTLLVIYLLGYLDFIGVHVFAIIAICETASTVILMSFIFSRGRLDISLPCWCGAAPRKLLLHYAYPPRLEPQRDSLTAYLMMAVGECIIEVGLFTIPSDRIFQMGYLVFFMLVMVFSTAVIYFSLCFNAIVNPTVLVNLLNVQIAPVVAGLLIGNTVAVVGIGRKFVHEQDLHDVEEPEDLLLPLMAICNAALLVIPFFINWLAGGFRSPRMLISGSLCIAAHLLVLLFSHEYPVVGLTVHAAINALCAIFVVGLGIHEGRDSWVEKPAWPRMNSVDVGVSMQSPFHVANLDVVK